MKNEKNCCIIPLFSNTPLLASKHFFSRKRAKLSHRGYYALYEYSTWGVNCQLFLHILSTFSVFSPVLYENFFYFPPFLLVFPITVAVTASVFYLQNNFSYPLLFSLYSAFFKKILFCGAKFLLDSKIFFVSTQKQKTFPLKGSPSALPLLLPPCTPQNFLARHFVQNSFFNLAYNTDYSLANVEKPSSASILIKNAPCLFRKNKRYDSNKTRFFTNRFLKPFANDKPNSSKKSIY